MNGGEFLILDFVYKFILVALALVVAVIALRRFDKLVGINFKESFEKVEENALAFSLYIGLRFVGIAIIISSII